MTITTGFVKFDGVNISKSGIASVTGGIGNSVYSCYMLEARVPGNEKMTIKFNLSSGDPLKITFNFCAVIVRDSCFCPLDIAINGKTVQSDFYPDTAKYCGFYDAPFDIPSYLVENGENTLTITMKQGSVFIRFFKFIQNSASTARARWQENLSNELFISEVNLPGTHDTAAINRLVHTLYACHNSSISDQLNSGIRALDIRIRVKDKSAGQSSFSFYTCHGAIGSWAGVNEYQSLDSAMDEIKRFLTVNPTEFIVIRFQIDDWKISNTSELNKLSVYVDLVEKLDNGLPLYGDRNNRLNRFDNMPKVADMRGKIFAFQTIIDNNNYNFGKYISMPDNEDRTGLLSKVGKYSVFIQDKFRADSDEKWKKVLSAIESCNTNKVKERAYINFASTVHYGVMGTYVYDKFINYLGSQSQRRQTKKLGWIFWDYENSQYLIGRDESAMPKYITVIDLIISSNFNYSEFTGDFKITAEWDINL
jgi:hypothetical protein